MNTSSEKSPPPENFYLLHDNLTDDQRPNRLCVCLSDVHFTDGTVGNQSAEAVVWNEVFDSIIDICKDKNIKELTLVLVGDVVDMIRTARWSQEQFYPWDRCTDELRFKEILRKIMAGIIEQHAAPPTGQKCGFFHLLKHYLPKELEKHNCVVQTLALVGNHDKEIFSDDETLKMFYEQCLGQDVTKLSVEYRHWIGKMYFNDEDYYKHPDSVPRLPFYWGDPGFRLFVTHGQWRDDDNCCRIKASQNKAGWQVKDGWRPDIWREIDYAPFTLACFGDTVAAGLLSGFIYRTKEQLNNAKTALIEKQQLALQEDQEIAQEHREIAELNRILDELDLYRPTYAAVQRIIRQIWHLRKPATKIETIIEKELLDSIYTWLGWDFTLKSATPARHIILRVARMIVSVIKQRGARIELGFIYTIMWLLTKLQQGLLHKEGPSYKEMLRFPGFLPEYRQYGFRIHGEGHTHIPLQDELFFNTPNHNYTYINFGTWRDQIVLKQKEGYRRRGFGRALSILDLTPSNGETRYFTYWVADIVHWGDELDKL